MSLFPNVPNVPGVPPLRRDPSVAIVSLALLAADVIRFFTGGGGPVWGVFLDGVPVIVADSVVSFDYKQAWYLSEYPVEQGAFESYDKVQTPFDAMVRLSAGGSEANRQAFLNSIAAIAGTLDLYDVVTPEVVYQSVNVARYNYKRTATNGVGLIVVDLFLLEVRVNAATAFTSTKSPSGANATNGGTVQPSPPTTTQTNLIDSVT